MVELWMLQGQVEQDSVSYAVSPVPVLYGFPVPAPIELVIQESIVSYLFSLRVVAAAGIRL